MTVPLAGAILKKETAEYYSWLLETYLKAGFPQPVSIMTRQSTFSCTRKRSRNRKF